MSFFHSSVRSRVLWFSFETENLEIGEHIMSSRGVRLFLSIVSFFQESVNLENQNEKMKARIQELEGELRNLKMILQTHKPTCVNPSPEPTPVSDPAQPPSFLSTCSKAANSGIMAGHTTSQCTVAPLPSQPSFSPLDLPEFLLTASPTTDDIFSKNLSHLPSQGFLFG